jgi:hypothetical protein
VRGSQPCVGCGNVAWLEHQVVARHYGSRRHHHIVTVSHHSRPRRGHRAQRHHGLLRTVFLKEANGSVDDHDHADGHRVEQFAQSGRDEARANQ